MALITPNLKPDLDALRIDFASEVLRNVVKDGWSVLQMATGMADAFTDATGIASLGAATYDGTNKLIYNVGTGATSYANAGGQGARTGSITVTASGWTGTLAEAVDGAQGVVANGPMPPTSVAGGYIRFFFGAGAAKVINEVQVDINNGELGTYKWQGSNSSGGPWTDLCAARSPNLATNGTDTWSLSNSVGYDYYQMIGVSGTSAGNRHTEFRFKITPYVAPPAVTVISAAWPMSFTPKQIRVCTLIDLGGGSMGADCNMSVGRDGANWAYPVMSNQGKFDASTNIWTGVADVSAQPASSNVYWRMTTSANYTVKNKGVWLQAK